MLFAYSARKSAFFRSLFSPCYGQFRHFNQTHDFFRSLFGRAAKCPVKPGALQAAEKLNRAVVRDLSRT
jgi:hypothetical protein